MKKPYHAVRFLYLNLKRLEGSIINSVGLSISLGTDVKNWEFTEEASQVESYIAIHFLEFLLHSQYQLTMSASSRNIQPSAFSYPKNFTSCRLAGSFKEDLNSCKKLMLNQLNQHEDRSCLRFLANDSNLPEDRHH